MQNKWVHICTHYYVPILCYSFGHCKSIESLHWVQDWNTLIGQSTSLNYSNKTNKALLWNSLCQIFIVLLMYYSHKNMIVKVQALSVYLWFSRSIFRLSWNLIFFIYSHNFMPWSACNNEALLCKTFGDQNATHGKATH